MKKRITALIAAALLVVMWAFPVSAASSGTITGTRTVVGTTVTLDVNIAQNPGIVSMHLNVAFDPAKLTLTSVTDAGLLGGLLDLLADKSSPYPIPWKDSTATVNNTKTGKLVTLTFTAKDASAAADSLITVTPSEIYTYDILPVTFTGFTSGTAPAVTYGDCNDDTKVNGQDLLLLKRYMANYNYSTGTSTVEIKAGADCNGDGKINGQDLLLLKRYMANYNYSTGTSTVVLGPQK